MSTRRGKIARLPLALREELNLRLLEGQETAKKICAWLNDLDEVKTVLATFNDGNPAGAIDDRNISDWRQGGYADWLRRREHIAETKELAAWSVKLAKASGGNISEGAAAIVSGQILEVLEQLTKFKDTDEPPTPEKIKLIAEAIDAASGSIAKLRQGDHNREVLNQNNRRLDQGDEKLAIEREKLERLIAEKLLTEAVRRKAEEISNSNLSNAEKISAMRKVAFADVDALEASGEVQLPK